MLLYQRLNVKFIQVHLSLNVVLMVEYSFGMFDLKQMQNLFFPNGYKKREAFAQSEESLGMTEMFGFATL